MTEKRHPMARVHRESEIDGESAKVRFSPGVVRAFAALEATVRGTNFDPDLLINLQELAAGKNYSVRAAVANMGFIMREATKILYRTHDEKQKQAINAALGELTTEITERSARSKPLTVIAPRLQER